MINIRSKAEMVKIRECCRLAARAMSAAKEMIQPGITTREIAEKVQVFIEGNGGKAAFLGYQGFPGSMCVSVNDEVVHGIPGDRKLRDGDLVKLDLGTYMNGFYGDMARTFPVGVITAEALQLMRITEQALYHGIGKALSGNRIGDIGCTIQDFVEKHGYGVVRSLVGHGIGRNLHEEPQVPNFGKAGSGPLLKPGMVLAIEPMVNMGTWKVATLEDNWTVVTADNMLSAHFENTCIVQDDYPEILTLMDGEEIWQKTIQ